MPIIIQPNSHEHWLSLRAEDITSTEVSALFGLSPYATEFELFYIKSRGEMTAIADNERMKWGRRLEPIIAAGVAEDTGMYVRPLKEYFRHSDEPRMGSSFDFVAEINNPEIFAKATGVNPDNLKGPGMLEIKNVDGLVYRDKWEEDEAPAHIELQLQHQLEVADLEWGMIVALVGGNDPKIIVRLRDREVGQGLRAKIREFWERVATEDAPEPDYEANAEFLIKLHQRAGQDILDASTDEKVINLLAEYRDITTKAGEYDKLKQAKKAEILDYIGDDYSKVLAWPFTLSCGMTADTPPTMITPEMVGQTYGGRKGYRNFRVNVKGGA